MSKNTTPSHKIRINRAYEAPARDGGVRILIDRLRPSGVKKENADPDQVDAWHAVSIQIQNL